MAKSTGGTRGSSASSPRGLNRPRRGYSFIPDNVLNKVDTTLSDLSYLLTDREVRQEFSFGDGYMARITVTSLPSGNNQATLGVYNDEDGFLGSQRIVLDPTKPSEVRLATEDIHDKVIEEIIKHRNNNR